MEIYLIRHTTPKIEKGICYGQADLNVADSFEEELKIILKSITFDENTVVYSSPLKRCIKLASKFSNNVLTDKRLMELNFGDWELLKWDDLPKEASNIWMNNFVTVSTPNGEAYIDLAKRANELFTEISSLSAKKIIIVTHAGVIRSILSKIKNIHLKDSFDIKVEYGQLFKIIKQNNTFTIL
ncbi:alpha-ribazole phosphatase family protein [Lutibacter sp. A80]|uniref:alpha-ribazole phosphatase family protein n=1 Tax=Lutibacter sp. A80 TaxID=2918453 RepID=UPI001F06C29C|nr:alpha-ribazole phosphatase family protein [Lutibacter sp. A80]UMB61119.1 alpha-ribazole phosphatase family protein [Lutibacter sp. A80]